MLGYTRYILCFFHALNKSYGNSEPYPKPGKLFTYRSIAQVRGAEASESGVLKLYKKKLNLLILF